MPPQIVDEVASEATQIFLDFYRAKRKEGTHIGYSLDSLAKDAVLLATRKRGIPIRDNKAAFQLLKSVGGEVPYSPNPYIEWLSYKLGLTEETKEKAKEIAQRYKSRTFKRGAPRVVASASIYIACQITGRRKTQKEIAAVAQCSEVSIRNNYQNMVKLLDVDEL